MLLLPRRDQRVHRLARPLGPGDALAHVLAGMTRRLQHRQDGAALGVHPDQPVEIAAEPVAARLEAGADVVEVLAQQVGIKHRPAILIRRSSL